MISIDEPISLGKKIYRKLFARNHFFEFNKYLYECSLHGMGCLNYENFAVSGERYFIKNVLNKIRTTNTQKIILDVGAFQGEYSKMVAELIPSARIFAFEPNPNSYQIACKAVAGNSHIQVFNTAISDSAGESVLYDLSQGEGSCYASLHKEIVEDSAAGSVAAFPVQLNTVDNVLESLNIPFLDLLKIDVEGNEMQVLQGARNALQNQRIALIHFEFNEMNISRGVFMKDMKNILSAYRLFRLLPSSMIEVPQWPGLAEIFVFQNIIAIRKDLF